MMSTNNTGTKLISLTPQVKRPEEAEETTDFLFFGSPTTSSLLDDDLYGDPPKTSLLEDDDDDEEDDKVVQSNNCWPPFSNQDAFDWTVPTHLIYQHTCFNDSPSFTHPFQTVRAKLDYSQFKVPGLPRQKFQDAILTRVLDTLPNNHKKKHDHDQDHRPCLVFLAGVVGAGKSYVLTQLHQHQLIPSLDDFVKIDHNMIQSELPEMAGYREHQRQQQQQQQQQQQHGNTGSSRSADTTTKHPSRLVYGEASQLSDLLFEHSLMQNFSMVVDTGGTFQEVEWYQQLLERLRRECSHYRLVILYVSAKTDVIRQRVQDRAVEMGQAAIPIAQEELEISIAQMASAVSALQSFTDLTVEIANNENEPLTLAQLYPRANNTSDNEEDWQWFADWWHDTADNQEESSPSPPSLKRQEARTPSIICKMREAFADPVQHESARSIWGKAYPNMCARCTVVCDGQCFVCIHKKHVCACEICKQ